ncbi:hypothetical protein UCRPA7_2966 [Phaeoacremonium minimum UCRPA7]|uniref:Uncharacterized protein n=1 Tax=Phaeoacremonium minimum (strain UCR-PA7) TaxID=1286976 RepID=R8BQ21_PHAM7|nr:hypothetical protein UCRPA7_2966 [Phaeoacremonium minimum UCRPA7]EOO01447.1 hypothetical protein UCRPA7_2966 [Phaeoacremonium minimum UCRPA7]
MATRTGSRDSIGTRDSRVELPSRHYQITPGNSPRNSATSADLKRMSAPPSANRSSYRGSYSEISLYDQDSRPGSSRPSTGTVVSQVTISNAQAPKPRAAKFSEAWYASESLVNRTQERNRAMNAQNAASKRRAYEALNQSYDMPESDTESDNDAENDENSGDLGSSTKQHPNPLRSNPTPLSAVSARPKTPHYSAVALSEVSLNDRRVSGSKDIADEMPGRTLTASPSKAKRNTWAPAPAPRVRNSSIQPEDAFFAKPYGELKAATPPIIIGANRQVSSGNDYDMSNRYATFGRRNVSGKIAEEGLAGGNGRYSRYSVLNDD